MEQRETGIKGRSVILKRNRTKWQVVEDRGSTLRIYRHDGFATQLKLVRRRDVKLI